jgi:hypothetical protein
LKLRLCSHSGCIRAALTNSCAHHRLANHPTSIALSRGLQSGPSSITAASTGAERQPGLAAASVTGSSSGAAVAGTPEVPQVVHARFRGSQALLRASGRRVRGSWGVRGTKRGPEAPGTPSCPHLERNQRRPASHTRPSAARHGRHRRRRHHAPARHALALPSLLYLAHSCTCGFGVVRGGRNSAH